MKYLLLGTILSGLMLIAFPSFAQDRDYRDEDRWHREDRGDAYWRGRLFDRIRDDVDHVQAITPFFSGDQFRLARVKQELNELQQLAATTGRVEERDLDDVISALQRVIADNRLPDRDRNLLNDDLNRLRDYKEHRERYYPRG
jgi:hypothetical protein